MFKKNQYKGHEGLFLKIKKINRAVCSFINGVNCWKCKNYPYVKCEIDLSVLHHLFSLRIVKKKGN